MWSILVPFINQRTSSGQTYGYGRFSSNPASYGQRLPPKGQVYGKHHERNHENCGRYPIQSIFPCRKINQQIR